MYKKYQAVIFFHLVDGFMKMSEAHRKYINRLIDEKVICSYLVTANAQTIWITLNARDEAHVDTILRKSPLFCYWDWEVHEVVAFDGELFRMPEPALN